MSPVGGGGDGLSRGGLRPGQPAGADAGDWDVATSARPETVQALFPRTVPTGLRHGTVTVLLDGMALEVTTFRREERLFRRPPA